MFAAVLDTCVLWPSTQRDFLLSLAVDTLYRPLWSEVILDELEYHEAEKLVDRGLTSTEADARAAGLRAAMELAFDDACVTGWEALEGSFGLPDRDDEHVVAATAFGGAGAIVTDNISDFPLDKVPSAIQVVRPAQFAADTVAVSPDRALNALRQMQKRRRDPPQSVEDLLAILARRYGMAEAVEYLASAMG
ncbi:PIN domain-containing protein [Gordonia sp. NPDC003424]